MNGRQVCCEDCRAINLTEIALKVMEKVIRDRMDDLEELGLLRGSFPTPFTLS